MPVGLVILAVAMEITVAFSTAYTSARLFRPWLGAATAGLAAFFVVLSLIAVHGSAFGPSELHELTLYWIALPLFLGSVAGWALGTVHWRADQRLAGSGK